MKKILFISINYNEEQKNLYTDLVEALIEKGHSVTVITSNSNNSFQKQYRQVGFKENITKNNSLIKKGITTITIGSKFKKIIKENISKSEKFDLILYATPPITFNSVVKFCKKRFNAKTYLMLKDIFPQNAVDLKMFSKKNPIYWFFRYKEKELYKLSEYIGCMSEGNVEYVLKHNPNISKNKIGLFYNSIKIREYIEIDNEKKETIFIFGGNLGKPQNILGLLNIIDKLSDYELAKFIIIGSGSEDAKIKNYIVDKRPNNLIFYEYLTRDEYEKKLLTADVGLISLDPRFTIPNIPSKLQSYMNLKKPILALTDVNTDLKEIISKAKCGWWYDARNIDEIILGIKQICENKQIQKINGKNGFEYLKKNYDVNINIKQLEKFMEE